jgi:calcineurin-like phosphoesterase family protein
VKAWGSPVRVAMLALGLVVTAGDAAWAAATVVEQPAAGRAGTSVALRGSGFARASSVSVSVPGRPRLRVSTDERGRFAQTITIPPGASGAVKITTRGSGRRVIGYFTVNSATGATATSEAATAGGRRIRWSPRAGYAGNPVRVRGAGLRHRARMSARVAKGPTARARTDRHGRLSLSVSVQPATPGRRSLRVSGGGVRLTLPFDLLSDPVVGAAGDIACGANSSSAQCEQVATSDLLLQMAPTAVLALGDVQYENGEYDNFLKFYDPSWGRLKAITHPAVGNHEYGTSDAGGCGFACGYFDYFNGVGQTFGPAGTRNQGFYAFEVGSWRLYAVNANCNRSVPGCGPGSSQLRWLQADLAAHPRACSLMFMHQPLFTSDTRNFDDATFRGKLRPLWQAFYDHGGDVVLTGHSHFYERYKPQDPQERPDPARGIRQFIVGTGGRNVYDVGKVEPTSEVRGVRTFGVIKLTLHSSSYDWRFVPTPGETFTDAGSQACH